MEPRPHTKAEFEERALGADIGDSATRLIQPGGSNYDFAVLHTNAAASGMQCFPMTPADLEGTAERTSMVAGGRLENLFGDHIIREGRFRAVGYVLRIPSHNGHWVAVLPSEDIAETQAGCALLCDSLFQAPFLLQSEEVYTLLAAAAFDGAAARLFNPNAFNARWPLGE